MIKVDVMSRPKHRELHMYTN